MRDEVKVILRLAIRLLVRLLDWLWDLLRLGTGLVRALLLGLDRVEYLFARNQLSLSFQRRLV